MTNSTSTHNKLIRRAIPKIAPPNSYRSLKHCFLLFSFAVVALFATSALSSCSKEPIGSQIENMEYFYGESLGLKAVGGDSIKRFATKVETYVYKFPEERKNPYYPDIVANIKDAASAGNLTIVVTINTEWDGEQIIYF